MRTVSAAAGIGAIPNNTARAGINQKYFDKFIG
jgi:hypothetical protein